MSQRGIAALRWTTYASNAQVADCIVPSTLSPDDDIWATAVDIDVGSGIMFGNVYTVVDAASAASAAGYLGALGFVFYDQLDQTYTSRGGVMGNALWSTEQANAIADFSAVNNMACYCDNSASLTSPLTCGCSLGWSVTNTQTWSRAFATTDTYAYQCESAHLNTAAATLA